LQAVCADAITANSNCKLHFDGADGIWFCADRAISLALIVNELVTNAVKYAFSNDHEGHIFVRLVRQDVNTALVSVRDDGTGLPPNFDLRMSKGLGMRIVTALAKQLGADISRTPKSREMSSSFWFPANKFRKGEFRPPDVRFGSLCCETSALGH
jgi:two-component sensor histidine kinase